MILDNVIEKQINYSCRRIATFNRIIPGAFWGDAKIDFVLWMYRT